LKRVSRDAVHQSYGSHLNGTLNPAKAYVVALDHPAHEWKVKLKPAITFEVYIARSDWRRLWKLSWKRRENNL
jgi:hypothetical protein